MLRGICRCLHYFYIVDCYCRVGRHFQRRSLLVSSCPQSAFGLTGGLLKGSSFRAVLCSGFAAVCILQTGCFVSTRFFPLYRDRNAVIFP